MDARAYRCSGEKQATDAYFRPSLVLYVSVTPESLRKVAAIARERPVELLLRGVDDSPTGVRRLFATARRDAVVFASLNLLAPYLEILPSDLRWAVENLLSSLVSIGGIETLAARGHMSRRSLDRWLRRAGFASARRLLRSARVIRAYRVLQSSDLSIGEVSRRLGYSSVKALEADVSVALGCPPSALRHAHRCQQVADSVARYATGKERPAVGDSYYAWSVRNSATANVITR